MIKLTVDVSRKVGEAGTFGSRGAGIAFSDIEIEPSMLSNPTALAARIRGWYELAEIAMNEELTRLSGQPAPKPAQVAGPATSASAPAPAPMPSANGSAHLAASPR